MLFSLLTLQLAQRLVSGSEICGVYKNTEIHLVLLRGNVFSWWYRSQSRYYLWISGNLARGSLCCCICKISNLYYLYVHTFYIVFIKDPIWNAAMCFWVRFLSGAFNLRVWSRLSDWNQLLSVNENIWFYPVCSQPINHKLLSHRSKRGSHFILWLYQCTARGSNLHFWRDYIKIT